MISVDRDLLQGYTGPTVLSHAHVVEGEPLTICIHPKEAISANLA